MTLKVEGDIGYGSVVGPNLSLAGSLGGSETFPLLVSETEPNPDTWKPLSREELESVAGGPGWKKFRSRLVLLFWVGWLTMLGIAVAVIIQSPRPAPGHLHWWQKELFYRLQPALFLDVESTGSGPISRVSERLPYLKSLGIGVMILEGLFRHDVSILNLTQIDPRLGTLPQTQQLITDSHQAGVKIILDLCEIDLPGGPVFNNATEMPSNASIYSQDSLRYWLEHGVSGFEICNADAAFFEKTLKGWRELINEYSNETNERIVMVRQMGNSFLALNMSDTVLNSSLVELVSKSLLPLATYPLSASEIAEAMETNLKTLQGEWPSWRVNGPIASELQKIFMVLMMTLPGTPIFSYGDEISQTSNKHHLRSTALFNSLSRTRSHEEALLYGTFTFLTFNTTSLNSGPSNSTAIPPLAFLRSWECVNFLVLFNLGSEPHSLDMQQFVGLPEEGMFVTSTGLDRLGSVSLQSIKLQPHEAIVMKLFEVDSDV
ncbi:amino acid transporter heavy chain SLC3A2 [Trichomycterus rosablanca]|uniref:amino acid transporter heavy chain SLC3A2 n=1 Tax=Trichomycterus rosablanca TaxID=2290929 RepID=UPI002F356663